MLKLNIPNTLNTFEIENITNAPYSNDQPLDLSFTIEEDNNHMSMKTFFDDLINLQNIKEEDRIIFYESFDKLAQQRIDIVF